MSKPQKPTWGYGDPSYAITPSAGKQAVGWLPGEKPPYQYMNWIHLRSGEWFTYLENKTETISPTMVRSNSTLSWNGSTITYTQPIDISFRVTTGEQINRIGVSASPITLLDGQVLVFIKDKTNASPVTLAAGTYSSLIAGQYAILNESTLTAVSQENEVVLFRRRGSDLEIPISGAIYPTGSTITLGNYSLPAGGITIDASQVVSGTFANARIAASNVTQHQGSLSLAASQITSGTFADARIAASNVTQHQAALSIAASQITSGTLPVARGGTGVTSSTGTGSVVLNNNPVMGKILFGTADYHPTSNVNALTAANTVSCHGNVNASGTIIFGEYNCASSSSIGAGHYRINFDGSITSAGNTTAISSISTVTVAPNDGRITDTDIIQVGATGVSIDVTARDFSDVLKDASISFAVFGGA